ncbi:MAG TPA: serine/threonine-protein kinase [Vicinamibacteria bacterium]|nr:serine/threonine-protein kinase [Vicinamibacteria bacterium]
MPTDPAPPPLSERSTLDQAGPSSAGSFGRYKLLQRLGEGGMGEVWLAEQTEPVHRQVALKVIKAGMDSAQVVARFEAERQALALMDHPVIATVFDGGTTPQGRPYFAMEYVKGEPMTAYCDRHRLGTRERLGLFTQVCEGVQHAHQKGIIHRDLKPSNVLVTIQDDRPVPKIIDFGVAKATARHLTERSLFTELGVLIGTPEYMSPEQAEMGGLDIDTRTDIYALGVLLYELLTGALPFDRKELRQAGLSEIQRIIREKEPPRPSTRITQLGPASTEAAKNRHTEPRRLVSELRGDLDWIAMRALEKDRTRRYQTANALAADVRRHLNREPVAAGPPGTAYRAGKFVRRHRFGVAAAVTLLLLLAAFAGAMAVQARRIARERDKARLAAEKAERINAFVHDMLSSADPRVKGRDVTVASVLDAASARVESELAGHPEVKAAVLSTLGTTYQGLGLLEPAEKDLKAALQARVAVFGAEHVEVARSLNALASVVDDRGDLREAERMNRQALAMLQRLGAADGEDGAQVLGDLARLLEGLGDSTAAEALYRETLAVERRLGGQRSEGVAATLNNLGVLLGQRGDWAGAEPLHREALEIARGIYGPEHPNVAAGMVSLGSVLEAKGDFAGAEALYRDSLAMRLKLLGPEHPDVTRSRYALAGLLQARGDAEGALRECRPILALRGRVLPAAHPMVAATLQIEGLSLVDLDRAREAEPLLRESLELRRQSLPPGHRLVAASESSLGACLLALRRFPEAEGVLLRGYEGLKLSSGEKHESTIKARQRLVALYEAWGKPEKAREWRARLATQASPEPRPAEATTAAEPRP